MSDLPGADQAAADIHAAFAKPVRYTGAGLANASRPAVRSDRPGDPFQGPGATVRLVTFEVRKAALPQRPEKGDLLVEGDGAGARWAVIERTERADIDAWVLTVEAAP